jgi:hypothetical protein
MTPPRKRPHCRKCGETMAGHKRRDGQAVCPEGGTTSSRATPCRSSPPPYPDRSDIDDIEIPTYGLWHRRNPNWVDDVPPRPPSTPYEGSVISTILNSDSHSVAKLEDRSGDFVDTDVETDNDNDNDNDCDNNNHYGYDCDTNTNYHDGRRGAGDRLSFNSSLTQSSGSFIGRVLKTSIPLASLFATPSKDIPHVRKAANKRGLHVGLVRNPHSSSHRPYTDDRHQHQHHPQHHPQHQHPRHHHHHHHRHSPTSTSTPTRTPTPGEPSGSTENVKPNINIRSTPTSGTETGLGRETSWWMVMGKSADAVRHLIDVQQKGMPGVFAADQCDVIVEQKPSASLALSFFQLALAGAFGGLAVVYGLSLL